MNKIASVELVNVNLLPGTAFLLECHKEDVYDHDAIWPSVRIIPPGKARGQRLLFPGGFSREAMATWAKRNGLDNNILRIAYHDRRWKQHAGRCEWTQEPVFQTCCDHSLNENLLCELAVLLAPHAKLEVGFFHQNCGGLDSKYFRARKWFGGEDEDDDVCGCRFNLTVGPYKSEWWVGSYRVQRVMTCSRETEKRFTPVWTHRDADGWGRNSQE